MDLKEIEGRLADVRPTSSSVTYTSAVISLLLEFVAEAQKLEARVAALEKAVRS